MKKLTKNQLERRKKFEGMTDFEIEIFIPKIPVTLFKQRSDGNIGTYINCTSCGKRHFHSWRGFTDAGPEYRLAHCEIVKGLVYPLQYELILDWSHGDNAKHQEQYLQQVADYASDPIAFNKVATRKQANYQAHLLDKRIQKLMYGEL